MWTDKGWSKIRRVIKHKTNKKIYKVSTHCGCVKVTEDHSLLDSSGNKIAPTECKLETKLLHSYPDQFSTNNKEPITQQDYDKIYIYGFFLRDGSCEKYGGEQKSTWELNSSDLNLCENLKNKLENIYGTIFNILDTITSSGVYKVVPDCEDIKNYIDEYHDIFYDSHKNKTIPSFIFTSDIRLREEFMRGFFDADGNRSDNKTKDYMSFDQKSQITTSHFYYLLRSMGYEISIKSGNDKPDIYTMTCTKNKEIKDPYEINKISEIKYEGDQWVYDLETENHHFQAGVGEMIVHNTDSIFCCPHIKKNETGEMMTDPKSQVQAIQLGIWASLMIGILLPAPMKLEYEKVLWPFVIQGKKRYVGNLYEKDPKKFCQKSMGIELKRRDNAPIVKTVSAGIISKIVNERDPEGAFEFMRDILNKIIHNHFKMDKFVITKTLRGNALTKEERIIEAKKTKRTKIIR